MNFGSPALILRTCHSPHQYKSGRQKPGTPTLAPRHDATHRVEVVTTVAAAVVDVPITPIKEVGDIGIIGPNRPKCMIIKIRKHLGSVPFGVSLRFVQVADLDGTTPLINYHIVLWYYLWYPFIERGWDIKVLYELG